MKKKKIYFLNFLLKKQGVSINTKKSLDRLIYFFYVHKLINKKFVIFIISGKLNDPFSKIFKKKNIKLIKKVKAGFITNKSDFQKNNFYIFNSNNLVIKNEFRKQGIPFSSFGNICKKSTYHFQSIPNLKAIWFIIKIIINEKN